MRLLLVLALAALLAACTTGSDEDGGPGEGMDAGLDAGPPAIDAGPRTCMNDVDCDDGFPCTIDSCIVGNVCDYTPVDARCGAEERCIVGRGCQMGLPADCLTNADCDDGDACTGTEMCAREMCIPGRPFNCSDGNACTTDICDQTVMGMCRYELADGCDGGTGLPDAGFTCDTFDPTTGYASGSFTMLPGAACDAGLGGNYAVSSFSFSVSGDTLTISAPPFTLTQTPVPTGASFDVTGGNGCANVRFMGTFECADRVRGTWMATHVGSCAGACPDTTSNQVGI